MNDATGHHHPHHSGAPHFHASVEHLAAEYTGGSRLLVYLHPDAMRAHQVKADDIVRLGTERGRSLLVRLGAPSADTNLEPGSILLDRFLRQALKAHLNEEITVERVDLQPAKSVELLPAIDVSTAHDLPAHIKKVLAESRTPLSVGAIIYITFPNTHAGTTYEVHRLPDGAGYVDESTDVVLHFEQSHTPEGAFEVTFEDVGGLGKQIKLIRELVQLPLKFPHIYRQLGISPPRGIILYGPPGSGKTHLVRALANEVEARFYYINGPDVVGTYSGETEGNLRRIFGEAGHHAPSIVFIDELDALAPKRGETGVQADIRAVTQLLSLMDGLKRVDSVIVVATTNRVDAVDPAFRRPGRFDREIFIGPPDTAGRNEILEIHTREMPLTDDAQNFLREAARKTHGFVGADIMELCRCAGLSALQRSTLSLEDYRQAFRLKTQDIRVDRLDFEAALSQVRPSALREALISVPDLSWRDIGGLQDVKMRLKDLLDLPLHNPQALAAAGVTPHVGILLYGPPGTGKTLVAQAIANESEVNFILVDGPELFTKWLGESEEAIRNIFRVARQVAPTVIFFDQLDAIAPVRGSHTGSKTTERVVNQLLVELDGVKQLSRVVVVAATNRLDLVDASVLRPGRFGIHVHVPLPDAQARREIMAIHLGADAYQNRNDLETILDAVVGQTEGYSGARLRQICEEAKRISIKVAGVVGKVAPELKSVLTALEDDKKFDVKGTQNG